MGEGRRPIPAPDTHETTRQRHGINRDGQQRPRQRNGISKAPHRCWQRCRQPDISLPGERDIGTATNHHALDDEGAKRDQQHDGSQHCGAAEILLRTHHGEENLG